MSEKLSIEEKQKLRGVHPKVIEKLFKILYDAKLNGLLIYLHTGYRSGEEQNKLYEQGRSKPGLIVTDAVAYESAHNFGLAFDLCWKTTTGRLTWDAPKEEWLKLGKIGEKHGFEWGGRWLKKEQKEKMTLEEQKTAIENGEGWDKSHFQILGNLKSISKAREMLDEKGITEVWKMV